MSVWAGRPYLAWRDPIALRAFGGPGAPPTHLHEGRLRFLSSMDNPAGKHPDLHAWLRGKLLVYEEKLVQLGGSTFTFYQIYSEYAGAFQRRVRREMEGMGFEKGVLDEWRVLDPPRETGMGFGDEGLMGEDFIDELSDQEV